MQQSDPEFYRDAIEALGDIMLPVRGSSSSSRKKA
jgi:hypothetical protein